MSSRTVVIIKFEKILFYIFLFLIPFQFRAILFWGGNEWNSIFLYGSDVIFLIIVVLWRQRIISEISSPKANEISRLLLIGFLIIAGVSLFFAGNLGVGMFRFIKLLEFALLFLYVRSNIKFLKSRNIFSALIASGAVQSLLAIGQFLKQSSLGLKFIEAGVYAPGESGVATFIMENGEKIMRAYGSFSHPNVLAGFMLLTIFCLYKLLIENPKSKIQNPKQIQNPKSKILNGLLITSYGLLVFGLFLTFSRTAIGVFLVTSLVMFLFFIIRRIERVQIIRLFGLFLISCVLVIAVLWPYLQARFLTISLEEQAIDLRFFYNKMAFAMIKDRPFLGIGIGNFVYHSQNYEAFLRAAEKLLEIGDGVPRQGSGQLVPSWIYQPVHNIYLLIAVETGIIALVIFLGFILIRLIRPITPITFLIIGFLILGLADHYFWTLHSGGVMFWLTLALASDRNKFRLRRNEI